MTPVSFDHAARIRRAREGMTDEGVNALLLSVGADLPYLTGYEAMPLERLTMFVLTPTEAVLVVPELEAPRVRPGPFELRAWGETEDPFAIVTAVVGSSKRVAIGDQTWARFLLRLQANVGSAFESATPVMSPLRLRKEPREIDLLREAAHAADRVAARLARTEMSGRTETELARTIGEWLNDEGHDLASFTIVASGPNGASPHHEATDRVVRAGDLVVMDFGGRLGGYCSDMTRTFAIGEPTDRQHEVHQVVKEAQQAAVSSVRPGVPLRDVDAAARSVIAAAGYGDYFIHRTGHGIGLEVHEEPYVIETNPSPAEPGMAFSIEPGVYLPGEFGARIEDIVVVTDGGVESLNEADRSLLVVG